MLTRVIKLVFMGMVLVAGSLAQNPCGAQHPRALVLGGGGSKGAFEAGAAYHLIVDRGCDFAEISGTSVGALNAAVLAQAARSANPEASLANLQNKADDLVRMWRSIKGTKDVLKGRPLASLRFGLFGLEAMKNFKPMRKLLEANFDQERLDGGRVLRVGAISFHDGAYREVVLNGDGPSDQRALDLVFGSAMIPMYGTMPRVPLERSLGSEAVQFGDGGLRHMSAVSSYFVSCAPAAKSPECRKAGNHGVPPHLNIAQVFVVVTSPYARDSLAWPVWDASLFKPGTRHVTDGRKVMSRAIDIVLDTVHHHDLDWLLLGNDLLKWRERIAGTAQLTGFPVESYNYDPQQPDAPSRPYRLGIIAPLAGDGGLKDALDFSPKRLAKMLYCGCLAADAMMQSEFLQPSMAGNCRERFGAYPSAACQSPAIQVALSPPAGKAKPAAD